MFSCTNVKKYFFSCFLLDEAGTQIVLRCKKINFGCVDLCCKYAFSIRTRQLYHISDSQKMFNNSGMIKELGYSKGCKFSLKRRSFRDQKSLTNLMKPQDQDNAEKSRFVSFMSQHNSNLINKRKQVPRLKAEAEQQSYNCFGGSSKDAMEEDFFSRKGIYHKNTRETLYSSTLSGGLASRQISSQEDDSLSFLKNNTLSILNDLLNEDQKDQKRKVVVLNKGQKKSRGEGSQKQPGTLSELTGFSNLAGQKKVYQKISLKKSVPNMEQLTMCRKESLTYELLSQPLNLGSQIQSFEFLALSNVKRVGQNDVQLTNSCDNTASRKSESECHCSHRCKWIDKWMMQIGEDRPAILQKGKMDDETLVQIEKDIPRTQTQNAFFSSRFYKDQLKHVLMSYCLYRPSVGYVQGMNMIASAIVFHSRQQETSKVLFNSLMTNKRYETIYNEDGFLLRQLSEHLSEEIKKYSSTLFIQLKKCDIDLEVFARNWYFSMLASFVPLQSMHLIIDKFIKKGFKGLNQILLTVLIYLKEQLLEVQPDELGVLLSQSWLRKRARSMSWSELVACSQNIMLKSIF